MGISTGPAVVPARFIVAATSATLRRIIINSLEQIGYNTFPVREASDGREAFRLLDRSITCMIVDWNMAELGGMDLANLVRTKKGFELLPILIVTSRSVHDDLRTAIPKTLDKYLMKPFTALMLRDTLHTMLTPGV